MISSGDRLYHVSSSGKIQTVTAVFDESGGRCDVRQPMGTVLSASVFDLFNTEAAANRAAISRLPGASFPGGMTVVKR